MKCKKTVLHYIEGWPCSHPCTRDAVKDGYCTQHHPDSAAARKSKSQERCAYKLAEAYKEISWLKALVTSLGGKLE